MALLETLSHNQLLVAGIGTVAASLLAYVARTLPSKIAEYLQRSIVTTVIINNGDTVYDKLIVFLARLPEAQNTAWLRVTESYNFEEGEWKVNVTFGDGWHTFRYNGKRVLLNRDISTEATMLSTRARESVTLRIFGRHGSIMRQMITDIEDVWKNKKSIYVYGWVDNKFDLLDIRSKRHFSQVFLPYDQKERLISDLRAFTEGKDEYQRLGMPYRRGYLFYGPPGTGKTTLALVIASFLDRPIYVIALKNMASDMQLLTAFSQVDKGSVILCEDIDVIQEARSRDKTEDGDRLSVDSTKGISMSGLLNAIDGVGSRENRILIMTTNYEEELDEALTRPGRVDLREKIGLLESKSAVREMAVRFLTDQVQADLVAARIPLPISPAELQQRLMILKRGK